MRKILFVIWILDTVCLLWLFGWMHFHGAVPGDSDLAGDLGAIWGALAFILAWMHWKNRKKASGQQT